MDNLRVLDPITYHQLKNLLIFMLGIISGFLIFLYFLRIKVLDFVKEDLGGKLKALQFYPDDSDEPITIINSKEQAYIPTLIYLSLIRKRKNRSHQVVWFSKVMAIFYAAVLIMFIIILVLALHIILQIQY